MEGRHMSRRSTQTLTEVELEFMLILWQHGEATSEIIQDDFRSRGRELSGGAIRRMLAILTDKGFVGRRKEGRSFTYFPAVSERNAKSGMVGDLLRRAFGGSAAHMIAALFNSRDISGDDLKKIDAIIATRRKEKQ